MRRAYAAIAALAGAAVVGLTAVDAGPSPLERAQTDLADCRLSRSVAQNTAQRNWANRCIELAQLRIDALSANPAPSPTVTPSSPTSPSPSSGPSSTPTASPTPSPTTPAPSPTTPSGWPGPDNTGVPAGTTLTTYTGPCTITTPTVIDAKIVSCSLRIQATGVVITRSRIQGSVYADDASSYSFTLADSEVIAPTGQTAVGAVNFTVLRSDISGGNRGVYCWHDCVIADSWIHGQVVAPDSSQHASGIRASVRTTIRHVRVTCDAQDNAAGGGCSAAITMYGDFATTAYVTVTDSLIGPGSGQPGFCAYGGSSGGKPYPIAHHIVFTGNVFQRGSGGKCGYWGAVTAFDTAATGNVWSGNTWDTGGAVTP